MLRVLSPDGTPDKTAATSATGRYAFGRKVNRETVVRVVYPGPGPCEGIVSAKRRIVAV